MQLLLQNNGHGLHGRNSRDLVPILIRRSFLVREEYERLSESRHTCSTERADDAGDVVGYQRLDQDEVGWLDFLGWSVDYTSEGLPVDSIRRWVLVFTFREVAEGDGGEASA